MIHEFDDELIQTSAEPFGSELGAELLSRGPQDLVVSKPIPLGGVV